MLSVCVRVVVVVVVVGNARLATSPTFYRHNFSVSQH